MRGTLTPPVVASEARDSPLDARTPAIAAPPSARAFHRTAFCRDFARCRNRHVLDSRFHQLGLCLCRVDSAISGDQVGWMLKERTVVLHRLHGLSMLMGMLQDLVAGDDASLHF